MLDTITFFESVFGFTGCVNVGCTVLGDVVANGREEVGVVARLGDGGFDSLVFFAVVVKDFFVAENVLEFCGRC